MIRGFSWTQRESIFNLKNSLFEQESKAEEESVKNFL